MGLIDADGDSLKYEIQEELQRGARIKVIGVGILGIRPSDFEDAAVSDRQWGTMQVTAGVTEEAAARST